MKQKPARIAVEPYDLAVNVAGRAGLTVATYAAALNARDIEALAAVVASDVVGHEPAHEVVGFDAFKANIETWLSSYTDLRITTDDLFDQDDRAAWRWSLQGTHSPTGRSVSITGIIIFRVRRGLIVEYWGHYDRLGMLEQQGLRG